MILGLNIFVPCACLRITYLYPDPTVTLQKVTTSTLHLNQETPSNLASRTCSMWRQTNKETIVFPRKASFRTEIQILESNEFQRENMHAFDLAFIMYRTFFSVVSRLGGLCY